MNANKWLTMWSLVLGGALVLLSACGSAEMERQQQPLEPAPGMAFVEHRVEGFTLLYDVCSTDADCREGFCHPDTRMCVECVRNVHCPKGAQCMNGDCVGLEWVCYPNMDWCQGDVHVRCDEDGATLTVVESCDDGDPCTLSDCIAGSCTAIDVDCDDDNPCTDDWCDPESGCVNEPNQAPCDDGDTCTTGDTCDNGLCLAGTPSCECLDDGDCLPYNPKNQCVGKYACIGGFCLVSPDTVVECAPAENPCQAAACDPWTGDCVVEPVQDGLPCDDGDPCTRKDFCLAGECTSTTASCDDGNECTADSCDPETGDCTYEVLEGLACDDLNACTHLDTCTLLNGKGYCTGEPLACQPSANPCQENVCLPKFGCVAQELLGPCDDDNVCTFGDHCSQGQCAGAGTFQCGDDGCHPKTGCSE